jgi:uncharacterized protein YjbJ (UPF0337 family)
LPLQGLKLGKDDSLKEGRCSSHVVKMQGGLNGSRRIETIHQTEEKLTMKPSTQDKTAGKLHELKGAIRQKAGELTKNSKLEADGIAEKNAGKVQNVIGKIEKAVGA